MQLKFLPILSFSLLVLACSKSSTTTTTTSNTSNPSTSNPTTSNTVVPDIYKKV